MPLNSRQTFDLPGSFLCFDIKFHSTLAVPIQEFICELLKGLQRHFSRKVSVYNTKNSLCFYCELNPHRGAHSPTFSCGNHPHNNTTFLMKNWFYYPVVGRIWNANNVTRRHYQTLSEEPKCRPRARPWSMHGSGTLLLWAFLPAESFKLAVCRLKGLVASLQSREILAPSRLADGRLVFLLNALNNRTANERGAGGGAWCSQLSYTHAHTQVFSFTSPL